MPDAAASATALTASARILALLDLLGRRTLWTAVDLAVELGITERTVRRDIERLRSLGYTIDSAQGVGGGYRLGTGKRLPPLLLDDAEAVRLAVALRTSLGSGSTSTEVADATAAEFDPAVAALAKLEKQMPARLREQVAALVSTSVALTSRQPHADPSLLVDLAGAIQERRCVGFRYTDSRDRTTERTAEPHRLLNRGNVWYLQAFDLDREDWRTFRVDRAAEVAPRTKSFQPRPDIPPTDHAIGGADPTRLWAHHVRVRIAAPPSEVAPVLDDVFRRVLPDTADPGASILATSGDSLDEIAGHLALIPWEFVVLEPAELRKALGRLAERLYRAAETPAP